MAHRDELGRIIRFAVIGLGATLVHVGLFELLHRCLDVPPTIATGLAFLCSFVASYIGQTFWVFAGSVGFGTISRLAVSQALGLGSHVGIMYLGNSLLAWHPYIPLGIGIIAVPTMTYLLNRNWVYAAPQESNKA